MKTKYTMIIAALLLADASFAQNQEIGLTLGRLAGTSRGSLPGRIDLGSGTALQANYGYRIVNRQRAALFAEVHLLANPQRQITRGPASATRDVASLFITPGLRLKFRPADAFSPYLVAGGGYAAFQQSLATLDGRPNPAERNTNGRAADFGFGTDFRVRPWLAFRAELRDFYTTSPRFNVPINGGQHNLVVGGGFVLKLGASER